MSQETITAKASAATTAQKKVTLTQSESLRIGERGEYVPQAPNGVFAQRLERHSISAWVEKRSKKPSESDIALRAFINLPGGYELVYGITYKGRDFDCGDMPRDLGYVVKGIEIATNI